MFEIYCSVHLVTTARLSRSQSLALILALTASLISIACGRGRGRVLEVVYVSAPQAFLRDRVAPVYNKIGTVKNAERVEEIGRAHV